MNASKKQRDSEGRRRRERGSALIVTTLLVLSLLVLGTVFFTVATTDRLISANAADAASAFNLAEAGLEDARAALPSQTINTLLAGGGNLFSNVSLNGGSYSVNVANNVSPGFPTATVPLDPGGANNDTDRYLLLTSTGQRRNARRVTEVVVRLLPKPFANSFWTNTSLKISGGGFTDSYDSSVGPYSAGTATQDGDVFSNGTINLSGGSVVKGDAGAVGSMSGVTQGVTVTGTVTPSAPPQTMANVNCPAGGYTPASQVSSSYNAATGVLNASGGTAVTLTTPPNTLYFSSVTLSGSSTLTLNTTAHVDMYVSGAFTVSGGGVVNLSTKPTNLTIWACGTSTAAWTLSGGSGAYFAVYAPTRKVTVSGTGDIWGAVVADQIDSSGGSKLHYDKMLGMTGPAPRVARSWREVIQ